MPQLNLRRTSRCGPVSACEKGGPVNDGESAIDRFFDACADGDAEAVGRLVAGDPALARATNPHAPHAGWTGLHAAARGGHAAVVLQLLERGAEVDAREAGDNTTALHWAAAHGHVEVVRALLDAGADVHGTGDVHELEVIGWATCFGSPRTVPEAPDAHRKALVALLVARGARHHIFSAMSMADLELIRQVAGSDQAALDRRLSRFEQGLGPLHLAVERGMHAELDTLIELGADPDATDRRGRTALEIAMLRRDRTAIERLRRAGARPPASAPIADLRSAMAALAPATSKCVPMLAVPDIAAALAWYTAIGFTEIARYEDGGVVNFGMVAFGAAELMFGMHGAAGKHDTSVWLYVDRVEEAYRIVKSHQLEQVRCELDGQLSSGPVLELTQDLEEMFYGARQFCVRDLNGYELYFIQTAERDERAPAESPPE